MAEEYKNHVQEPEKMEAGSVESTDRGLFGKFLGKKDEAKPETTTIDHYPGQGHPGQGHPGQGHPGQGQEQVIPSSQFDHKVHVSEPQPPKYEENKDGLLNKLHRSKSSSSSSSEEEVEEGGERRRRKKDKTKKVTEGGPLGAAHEPVEKKGLVNKIKEKIPGQGGKDAAVPAAHAAPAGHVGTHHTLGDELASTEAPHPEEKKGIMEKIKEKLPGYHPKGDEAHKDKDTTYNN